MYKTKELRNQTIEELRLSCEESRKKLFVLQNRYRIDRGSVKHHEIGQLRKGIARILTVMTEKERM